MLQGFWSTNGSILPALLPQGMLPPCEDPEGPAAREEGPYFVEAVVRCHGRGEKLEAGVRVGVAGYVWPVVEYFINLEHGHVQLG